MKIAFYFVCEFETNVVIGKFDTYEDASAYVQLYCDSYGNLEIRKIWQ